MRPRRGFPMACILLLALGVVLPGCDPFHRQQVLKTPPLFEEEVDEAADVSNLAPETKGFFKRDRTAGTWSSEAREIEEHFGATDF